MGLLGLSPEDEYALAGLLFQMPDKYGRAPMAPLGQYLMGTPERKRQAALQEAQQKHMAEQTKALETQNQGMQDINLALQNRESIRQAGLLSPDATPEGLAALKAATETQNQGLLGGAAMSGDANLLQFAQQQAGIQSPGTYANTPIWGRDKKGNPVILRMNSDSSALEQAQVPEGIGLTVPMEYVRAGDKVIPVPKATVPGMSQGLGGAPASIPIAPSPEAKPEFREAQQTAITRAEMTTKREQSMLGLGAIISQARDLLTGVKTDSQGKPSGVGNLPTSSGVGSLIDKSAAFFGASPKGAKEATALEAVAGALVSKMPRMEGPQSNYDVDNYVKMAGRVGDRALPIEQRLAALNEVEKLWAKYDKTSGIVPNQNARPPLSSFQR